MGLSQSEFFSFGKDEANERIKKAKEEYAKQYQKMSKIERYLFVRLSNEALALDESLFSFIAIFGDNKQIRDVKNDLETYSKND